MIKGERAKEVWVVLLIVAAAFLLRYWHLSSLGWVDEKSASYLGMILTDSSILHFSDADSYTSMAKDVLEGRGLNLPFNPPMVTFLLIALYKVFGYDYFAAKIVYALLGSLALIPVYWVARELFGKAVAFATILLCAGSFTLIMLVGALNIENVYLFTLSVAVAAFVALYRERGLAGKYPLAFAFVFGLCSAAALLTRSEFALILAVFFVMGVLKRGWGRAHKAKVAVFAVIGLALALAPYTYRNYVYMADFNNQVPSAHLPVFVPVAMNGPFNFVEGHSPYANGTYAPAVAGELKDGYMANLNAADPVHLAFLRDGFRIGWEYAKHTPKKELENLPVKARVFLRGFANGFLLNNFMAGMEGGSESMADSFVPDSKWLLWLLFALFGVGAVLLCKEGISQKLLPLAPVGAVLFTCVVFYGLSRLVYPVLPFFFMVASVALVWLWRKLNCAVAKPYLVAAIVAAVFIVAGFAQSRQRTILAKEPMGGYGKFHLTVLEKVPK
ncbi:MAG: glycosyltransferase family 39 protein [Nitrospinae bacterium]|nr:glycosyltransferase family 39 protein [Nitrospinota bacterium]